MERLCKHASGLTIITPGEEGLQQAGTCGQMSRK